jgi:hypothetical protein
MVLNFLVGVEGSGHNLTRALLEKHLQRDTVVDSGDWHEPMNIHWDSDLRFAEEKTLKNLFSKKDMRTRFEDVFGMYREQGVTHLFESASFPYNQPRDPMRRPDILEFEDLCQGLVEIRYIVLYRDPLAAAYSGVRRGFSENVYLQARLTEDNMIFIERQFSQIPESAYRILHFDKVLAEPKSYCDRIGEWWDVNQDDLAQGIGNLLKPHTATNIPHKHKLFLEQFYSDRRRAQWQAFFESNQI